MVRKKKPEKYKSIIDAAVKVFAREGFHNAKIQDIAKEAGIAHGTVYIYFDSKDALLISVFEEKLGELIDYVKSEIEKIESPEEKIRRLISLQVEIMKENPNLTELMLVEFPQTGRFLDCSAMDRVGEYIELITDILKQGVSKGIFDSDIDSDMLATIIYAGIYGLATRWILEKRDSPAKEMVDGIANMFLNGIKS
ncbi:TetR family transcriptional regulator [Candidatus Poribacteria bacterium]|nr:TetR family transcriptional regulator [Candidatus Poribacteria bacterium]